MSLGQTDNRKPEVLDRPNDFNKLIKIDGFFYVIICLKLVATQDIGST
ncbi:MAG: hypothetical protein IIB73_05140 [Proteobacteria bacterium]|nr:hypothetical protein [Pseudomonadota bacterium]